MRLTGLRLKNWRGFRGEVELDFDADITVIAGPNESGKSTLVEAAIRGLFDRHTAGGQAVEALRPWGSSLAPEVWVSFRARDDCYQIHKRFLLQPASELFQLVNGRWEPIAEGDAADRRVLELVGGRMPASGLSRSQHHGLIQALWAPQGSEELPSAWNREVTDTLEAVLGSAAQTEETTALERRIREEHLRRLTEVRGEPRAGSDLDQVIRDRQQAEQDYQEISEQRRRLEERLQELNRRQEEIRQIATEFQEANERLQEAERELKAAQEHLQLRLELQAQVEAAQREYDALYRRVKGIREAEEALKAALDRKGVLEARLKELEAEIAEAKVAHEKLAKELGERRAERNRMEVDARALRDLIRMYDLKEQIGDFQRDLETAEAVLAEIRGIRETMEASISPSDDDIREARALERKVREGEAVLRARGLTLEVSGKQPVTLKLGLDDRASEPVVLEEGPVLQFHAGTRIQVEIPDLVSFTVTSGSDQARQALEGLERSRESLRKLLTQFAAANLEELEQRHQLRQEQDNRLGGLKARLEGLRLDGDPDQLRRRIRGLEGELAVVQERLDRAGVKPEWENRPPEYLQEVLGTLEKRLNDLDEAIERLEAGMLGERVETLGDEIKRVSADIARQDQVAQQKQEELEKLRREDAFGSDAAREVALNRVAADLERTRRAYEVLERERKEKEDQPRKRHEALQKRVASLQAQLTAANVEAARIQGALVDAGGQDIYQKQGNLEAKLNRLRQREERLRRDAQAWRLLDLLVAEKKKAQLRALTTPVKQQVDAWLTRIAGTAYAGVEFSEALVPVGVRVVPWGMQVPLQELSYGMREQLGVLVRLAIGLVVSQHEPQVVVLDDRLVNTDPGRLHEFRFILQEVSEKVQLILLTCHPGRYSGMTQNFIDLRALRS